MNTLINQKNKHLIWNYWQKLDSAKGDEVNVVVNDIMIDRVQWFGFDPILKINSAQSFCDDFWKPFTHCFSNMNRLPHVFIGGQSNGRKDGDISKDGEMWVSGTGYFNAVFKEDYLGIPSHGKEVNIRWGEFIKIRNGKIIEIYFQLDLIDLMQQVGVYVLPPSKGKDHVFPPPKANDGILLEEQNIKTTEYSLSHIRQFIFKGLNSYDQSNLESMGMADYFNSEVKWYGPGGIGACLSFKEFESFHQQPWLTAYPDRQVQDLDALIAEGNYSGGPGWAGVIAKHTGQYLDCPATNNNIVFNGLDWWKREDEQYIENWVFVDMIHLFRQFGIDLFDRIPKHL